MNRITTVLLALLVATQVLMTQAMEDQMVRVELVL